MARERVVRVQLVVVAEAVPAYGDGVGLSAEIPSPCEPSLSFAAERGLEMGEFDVLTTLQRSGPPYELTAGAFRKAAMVTSGAITNRIDRMEAKGLVERVRDTGDRRTVKIRLTERGHDVTRTFMKEHLANEARLLADFDREECEELAAKLRKLLVALGDTTIK